MDYRQIVWLSSYPKSGNTWVRCFLDAYFLREVNINELLSSIADTAAHWYAVGDGSEIQDLPIEIQHLARPMAMLRLVRQYMDTNKQIPLFVKTHTPNMQVNGIEGITEMLTKSVIHIVRDPRDILPSFSKHMGVDLDTGLEWMQEKYRTLSPNDRSVADFIGAWDAHIRSFLNDDCHKVMWIRYEDMLEDPVLSFTRILEHAGVDPDKERVKVAVEIAQLSRMQKQEKENGFNESSPKAKNEFFGKGGSESRDKLTPKHLHTIEKAFGSTMKRLGYNRERVAYVH
jgi:hypothetical protein